MFLKPFSFSKISNTSFVAYVIQVRATLLGLKLEQLIFVTCLSKYNDNLEREVLRKLART